MVKICNHETLLSLRWESLASNDGCLSPGNGNGKSFKRDFTEPFAAPAFDAQDGVNFHRMTGGTLSPSAEALPLRETVQYPATHHSGCPITA